MDELMMKRLAVIKQLYNQGLIQSYDSEPMNGFCLLSFHDSVEMFMALCSEKRGILKKDISNFYNFFDKITDLQCRTTMFNLNKKRVALKHEGSLPALLDIEISRVYVTEFFNQNTPIFFDIEFSEISLVSLVKYESVKEYLSNSLNNLKDNDFENSIINSHIAFKELLYCFEEDKYIEDYNIFGLGQDLASSHYELDNEIETVFDKVKENLSEVNDIIKILGYGIDYKKYTKFNILSPTINLIPREVEIKDGRIVVKANQPRKYNSTIDQRVKSNERNSKFCFDFVIDCTIKLQNFDFEINDLLKVR